MLSKFLPCEINETEVNQFWSFPFRKNVNWLIHYRCCCCCCCCYGGGGGFLCCFSCCYCSLTSTQKSAIRPWGSGQVYEGTVVMRQRHVSRDVQGRLFRRRVTGVA